MTEMRALLGEARAGLLSFIPVGSRSRSRRPRQRWNLVGPMALPQPELLQVFWPNLGQYQPWLAKAAWMLPGN